MLATTTQPRRGRPDKPAATRKPLPGGRPPKSNHGPANDNILIRIRSDEKAKFKAAAEAEGKTLTDWILERLRSSAKTSSSKRRPKG